VILRESPSVYTDKFLMDKDGVRLELHERLRLEAAIGDVKQIEARTRFITRGEDLHQSTLLLEGIMCRYVDDNNGQRQLVAVHVPGDFVDLHAYPLKRLDHNVGTMTSAKVATIPHVELDKMVRDMPELTHKLWFATLVDAAIHRAWLFRLGRLDAIGRVAHFLSETNARLAAVGLSDGYRFELNLIQSDIAEICGLTNVHVNRVMRSLREENLCVFRSSVVEILDPLGLASRGQFNPAYLYNAQSIEQFKSEVRVGT
jgi:CRP-like cAMP-binding protein